MLWASLVGALGRGSSCSGAGGCAACACVTSARGQVTRGQLGPSPQPRWNASHIRWVSPVRSENWKMFLEEVFLFLGLCCKKMILLLGNVFCFWLLWLCECVQSRGITRGDVDWAGRIWTANHLYLKKPFYFIPFALHLSFSLSWNKSSFDSSFTSCFAEVAVFIFNIAVIQHPWKSNGQ